MPDCSVDPSFSSIECRLAEMPAQIVVAPGYETYGEKLDSLLTKAEELVEQGQAHADQGRAGKARRSLSHASTRLKRFIRQLGTKKGVNAIEEPLRVELEAEADGLRTDIQLLRESL